MPAQPAVVGIDRKPAAFDVFPGRAADADRFDRGVGSYFPDRLLTGCDGSFLQPQPAVQAFAGVDQGHLLRPAGGAGQLRSRRGGGQLVEREIDQGTNFCQAAFGHIQVTAGFLERQQVFGRRRCGSRRCGYGCCARRRGARFGGVDPCGGGCRGAGHRYHRGGQGGQRLGVLRAAPEKSKHVLRQNTPLRGGEENRCGENHRH